MAEIEIGSVDVSVRPDFSKIIEALEVLATTFNGLAHELMGCAGRLEDAE